MTLYTLDNNSSKKMINRKCKISRMLYIIITLFCFVFQWVYGKYSHGVSSVYMTWAFVIPLAAGLVNELSYHIKATAEEFNMRRLLAGGTAWLLLGSIFQGVLEIYGTTNKLTIVLLILGVAQIAGAITLMVYLSGKKSECCEE